jgi:hypothetical protein
MGAVLATFSTGLILAYNSSFFQTLLIFLNGGPYYQFWKPYVLDARQMEIIGPSRKPFPH